ncbi:MAG: hypothetical protein JWQ52_1462 [Phenylobacterium sp.]|jgi:hypothetical protein|nr:hypothetical protein [Phenylobacterium sp.]
MQEQTVCVRPLAGGWSVECDAAGEPLVFLSGARAEEKAHGLARCLAFLGRDVRLTVQDRSRQIVGETRYAGRQWRRSDQRALA